MDKDTEQRVWQRVYGKPPSPPKPRLSNAQRLQLRRCLERANANLRFYEEQSRDPAYGQDFAQLSAQARREAQHLRQLLGEIRA